MTERVPNEWTLAKKVECAVEQTRFALWAHKHDIKKLIRDRLEEIEGKKRPISPPKPKVERTIGPLPPGFHFHKKRIDYVAGRQVSDIVDVLSAQEFVKSYKINVDPKELAVLYKRGRKEYLKRRLKYNPIERENQAKVTSWQHGWWLGYVDRAPASLVSRSHAIKQQYRLNGVFREIEGPITKLQHQNL